MDCPVCAAPMVHMGYFSWACDDCGHSCAGDLPHAHASEVDDEGTP
jgi:ribosomal protein L37AE/L43A